MSGVDDDHRQQVQEKSRKRPMEQSSSPTINLKIKGQDGVEVFFKIPRKTRLQKLLQAYCRKLNLDYRTLQFLYEGDRFSHKRSPDDLNMEDGDEIEAMMHQGGGGKMIASQKTS